MIDKEIEKALEVLKKGGVILYPTDTVWGLGCDATNSSAVEKIYKIKQRSDAKGMLILLDKLDKVSLYVQKVPEVAWELFEAADSPMTLILPDGKAVADNLLPEERTVGIRVTNHPFCQKLIYRLNRPLVSTSANVSGKTAPSTLSEVSSEILEQVDYVVDQSMESRATKKPSSIIKLGLGGEIEIIRN